MDVAVLLDPVAAAVFGREQGAGPTAQAAVLAEQEARRSEAPAGEAPCQAQVDVVVVAKAETGIEQADLPVTVCAHEHGLQLHEVLLEHAGEHFVLGHVRHRQEALVLDATVRMALDDHAAGVGEVDLGMGLENRQVTFEALRHGDVVVVKDP